MRRTEYASFAEPVGASCDAPADRHLISSLENSSVTQCSLKQVHSMTRIHTHMQCVRCLPYCINCDRGVLKLSNSKKYPCESIKPAFLQAAVGSRVAQHTLQLGLFNYHRRLASVRREYTGSHGMPAPLISSRGPNNQRILSSFKAFQQIMFPTAIRKSSDRI